MYIKIRDYLMSVKEAVFNSTDNLVGITPGFFCGDVMMSGLKESLSEQGFKVFTSGITLNLGLTSFQVSILTQRFLEATKDNKKATLIGHSLGGIYSLFLAENYPNRVKKVITLGTPLTADPRKAAYLPARVLASFYLIDDMGVFNRRPISKEIELHSIYTPIDEVVDYRTCLDHKFTPHEVTGSHINLPNNKDAQNELVKILRGY